jgi:hypothetical protein
VRSEGIVAPAAARASAGEALTLDV